jgi:hypothetical protein
MAHEVTSTAQEKLASVGLANNAAPAQAAMSFPVVESTETESSKAASGHIGAHEGGYQ